MDLFALSLKLQAEGVAEAQAGLAGVQARGQQAAQSLTAAEVASRGLSTGARASKAALDPLNVSLAAQAGSAEQAKLRIQELDAAERQWTATMSRTAPAAGAFNQQ